MQWKASGDCFSYSNKRVRMKLLKQVNHVCFYLLDLCGYTLLAANTDC